MQFHQTPSTSRFSMAFALWMVVSVLTVPLNFADDPPSPTDNPTPPAEGTPPAAIPTEPPPGRCKSADSLPKCCNQVLNSNKWPRACRQTRLRSERCQANLRLSLTCKTLHLRRATGDTIVLML